MAQIKYAHHECDQHEGEPRPKLWCGSRKVHTGHHWDWTNIRFQPETRKMWCDGATEEEIRA